MLLSPKGNGIRNSAVAILASFIMTASLLPLTVFAETKEAIPPEFNPLCWKLDECNNIRAQIMFKKDYKQLSTSQQEDLGSGNVKDPENCPGDFVKCLPAGATKATIGFGGIHKFSDIGDFIKVIYSYAIGIAGILAAVMLIVAGFQWITSSGNSELIEQAKHRITGAVTGLILAYMSYFILNTINPALVSLRIPQVFMVRPRALVPQFCSAATSTTKFAFAADSTEQNKVLRNPTTTIDYNLLYHDPTKQDNEKNFWCGKRFYMEKAGGVTCFGDYCDPDGDYAQLCSLQPTNGNKARYTYQCSRGNIIGTVVNSSFFQGSVADAITGSSWNYPPIWQSIFPNWTTSNNVKLVCGNGSVDDATSDQIEVNDIDERSQSYKVSISNSELNSLANACGGGLRGIVLQFAFNYTKLHLNSAEEHIIGKNGIDLGDIDFFKKYNTKISNKYFLSLDEVKKGIIVNIDAANVTNLNSERGFWTGAIDIYSTKHGRAYGYLIKGE